jgi:ankyrin repeat protein
MFMCVSHFVVLVSISCLKTKLKTMDQCMDDDDYHQGLDACRVRLQAVLCSLVRLVEEATDIDDLELNRIKQEIVTLVSAQPKVLTRKVGSEVGDTPLHYGCRHFFSLDLIKKLICPQALRMMNNQGETPLNLACQRADDMPSDVIKALIDPYPESICIADQHGETPLHIVCEDGPERIIRLLLTKCPEAAQKQNPMQQTPLHLLCERPSETQVCVETIKMAIDCFPDALTMTDSGNDTPLHAACVHGISSDVLELLVKRGPKVLSILNDQRDSVLLLYLMFCDSYVDRFVLLVIQKEPNLLHIVNHKGKTPLQLASLTANVPVKTLSIMIYECPAMCLIRAGFGDDENVNDAQDQCCIPLDLNCVRLGEEEPDEAFELIFEITMHTLCSLIECALSSQCTMPMTVTNHLRDKLVAALPDLDATASAVAMSQSLPPLLAADPDLVHALVDCGELQELLQDEYYQELIGSLNAMSMGRDYFLGDAGDKQMGVCVLTAVSQSVDCLFVHLRENLALCNREMAATTPSAASSNDETEVVAEPRGRKRSADEQ